MTQPKGEPEPEWGPYGPPTTFSMWLEYLDWVTEQMNKPREVPDEPRSRQQDDG